MQDNARLAQLILDRIDESRTDPTDEAEFIALLEAALTDGRSRLDLRDRLMNGARDSNAVTRAEIVDVIGQSLSDEIRDINELIAEMEDDLLPSRLALGSLVGLLVGTVVTLLTDSSDMITSAALAGALAIGAFTLTYYRKRTFRRMSALRVRRANYESFRKLLQDQK